MGGEVPVSMEQKSSTFSEVWVSSIEHMDSFTRIWKKASKIQRFFGICNIPSGFPYTRYPWWWPWPRPLVFFANGRLSVTPEALAFETQPRPAPFCNTEVGLRQQWSFVLRRNQVAAVKSFTVAEPFIKFFTLPWVHLRGASVLPASDGVLLAIVATTPWIGKLRRENAAFLDVLQRWHSGA